MVTPAEHAIVLSIDGHDVTVTNLDRLLFPAASFTKRDLLAYYLHAAPKLLPHLAGHPVTLRRYPTGAQGPDFFQTRAPPAPEWVETTTMHFPRTGKTFESVVIDGLAALVWAVNLSTVEVHPFLGCAGALARPTALVFDLDPGPPAGLHECAVVACRLREQLDALGLETVVKTSGGVGLHVYVPLGGRDTYEATKPFAHALAALLERATPDLVVDVMTRAARPGKVFIDWSQNDAGKSTVAPYSLRGFDRPTVSMPVTWDEVERAADREVDAETSLRFDVWRAVERMAAPGDPFAAALGSRQALPSLHGGAAGSAAAS